MDGIDRCFLKAIPREFRLNFADFCDAQAQPIFGIARHSLPVADNVNMALIHNEAMMVSRMNGSILLSPIIFLQGDHFPRPALAG